MKETRIKRFNENSELNISDVRSSIQFEVDETTGEIKLPKTLIDIPKEYYL
jgi:hypothetical protein